MVKESLAPLTRWNIGSDVYYVAVSNDGTRVVYSSKEGHMRVWDVNTGSPIIGLLGGHTQ